MTIPTNNYGATYDAATGQAGPLEDTVMKIPKGTMILRLAKAPEVREATLVDGTVEIDANLEVEAVTIPASKLKEIDNRIADLEAQLAEAQRREGLPDSLLDLVRVMCNVWDKINDWAMNNVETDALMSYPMIQGIRNQMMLRMIGAQPYNTDKIREAVEWMINTQAAIDGGAMGG